MTSESVVALCRNHWSDSIGINGRIPSVQAAVYDVDFETGLVIVRRGKGGRSRVVRSVIVHWLGCGSISTMSGQSWWLRMMRRRCL